MKQHNCLHQGAGRHLQACNGTIRYSYRGEGKLLLERLRECYTRHYSGIMYSIANRYVNIFVMPGTRILAKIRRHTRTELEDKWVSTRAENIKKSWQLQIPVSGSWEGGEGHISPTAAYEIGLWCSGVLHEHNIHFNRESVCAYHRLRHGNEFSPMTADQYIRLREGMSRRHLSRELNWDMLLWHYEA